MTKRYMFLTGIMLLTSYIGYAQNVDSIKITGKVTDDQSHPLAFANVLLMKAGDTSLVKGKLTDEKGLFEIDGAAPGSYFLEASMLGYTNYYQPVTITQNSGTITVPSIVLHTDAKLLTGITVKLNPPLIEQRAGKLIVNVGNRIVSTGGTALDVLSKAPEITVDPATGIVSLKGNSNVLITINGRQTHLSAADVSNLLKSMPADQVSKLEIIANPSSNYDAQGTGGIINIVTKKNTAFGNNGTLKLGGGYGKYGKFNDGITLNHRSRKLSIYGTYNYRYDKTVDIENLTTNYLEDKKITAIHETRYDAYSYSKRQTYNAGLDWSVSDRSTVGIGLNGYHYYVDALPSPGYTRIFDNMHNLDSTLLQNSSAKGSANIISSDIYFTHTFDSTGRKLSLEAEYSVFKQREHDDYTNVYEDISGNTGLPYLLRDQLPIHIDIKAAKADYVQPFKKNIKLALGIKASEVSTNNNALFELYNHTTNSWINDPTRSNDFTYKENINAAYADLTVPMKKTTFRGGLRVEQTISDGSSVTMDSTVKRNYTDFFPSVFVNRTFDEDNSMSISYSRRINRPDYQNLNPFISFIDLYSYNQGNSFLQPVLTNSFELSYVYKSNYIVSIGYEKNNGAMSKIPELVNSSRQITRVMPKNLGYEKDYSLNFSANFDINKWWKLNSNAGVYYTKNSGDFPGGILNNNKVYGSINISTDISLPAEFKLELSGYYYSSLPYGVFIQHPLYQIDGGLRKSLFKNKLDMSASFNDILNSGHTLYTSDFGGLQTSERYISETRKVFLALTYKFGNRKLKEKKHVNSAATEETKRISQ